MDRIDVTALLLGLDADARAEVQGAMNRIAETGDSGSSEGRVQMLREAVALLRGLEASWTHAGAEDARPMPPEEAEARFVALAHRARSRFEHELVRNVDGQTTREHPPELAPSTEPGVVVVTVVVAASVELADVHGVHDRAALALAFDALAALDADSLVAFEVIWSPADDRDRASVEAIERKYPELTRLDRAVA